MVGLKTRSTPGQFLGSYVANQGLTTCLVQLLSWVFGNQENKENCELFYPLACRAGQLGRLRLGQFLGSYVVKVELGIFQTNADSKWIPVERVPKDFL